MAEDALVSPDRSGFSSCREGEEGDGFFLSRLDWSVGMHRVFLLLIGRSEQWTGAPFSACRVPVRDVRELAQVSQKSIYEEMAEATARLVREPIEFGSVGEQEYEAYPIFSTCKYKSREGMIEAKFNEDARPYLLQLREHFTQYRLHQAIPLSTPYAIRTYEIAKMIERPGERRSRQIPVSRFRKMFSLENKYDRHRDMRRRVIDPSVEQVNEKTDVDVRCEDVRDEQTPIALQWTVESTESGRVGMRTKAPLRPDTFLPPQRKASTRRGTKGSRLRSRRTCSKRRERGQDRADTPRTGPAPSRRG